MSATPLDLILGTLQGLGAITVFLLALFIGVSVAFTLVKFRPTRNTRTIKNLDELVGTAEPYLPPDAPRGPSDQLAGSRRAA